MDYSSGLMEEVHITSLGEVTLYTAVCALSAAQGSGAAGWLGPALRGPHCHRALGVYTGFPGPVGEKALPEACAAAGAHVYEHL